MATVTITSITPQPPLQVQEGETITFRGWYTNAFVGADGVTPVEGGNGQTGFFYEWDCELNDDGNVVIPAIEIQPTTESNPTAGFFGQLFINDAPGQMIIGAPQATAGWQIPTSPSPTTFGALALYNAAAQLLYPPNTYPTFDQVVQLIQLLAGQFQYAAVGINGIGQPSVAPDVASAPIFWGVNDPAVGDLHGTLTQFRVPRASSDKSVVDGLAIDSGTDFSIPTLDIFQAGDYEATQNNSFISVNDSFTEDGGRAVIQAGGSNGDEYAGMTMDCSTGTGEVNVQSTGITHLFGANQVTIIGDGRSEQNGTQLTVNDPTRMVVQTTANQAPNDLSINEQQTCFYLDEGSDKLKARIRLTDGTYATWEGTFTRD